MAGLEVRIESAAEPRALNLRGYAGSAERLRAATGWAPQLSLADSLADVFTAYNGRVAAR